MQGLPLGLLWSLDIPMPLVKLATSPSLHFFHSPINSGNLVFGTMVKLFL